MVEGVVGEWRRSFVDRLRVKELHGLGRPELEKCSEGVGIFWHFSTVRKKAKKERKKMVGCKKKKEKKDAKGKRRGEKI